MASKPLGENPRPPLITPSVSPPPQTWSSRHDAAPPYKRQRLTSVSRSSSSRLSVSAADAALDIQKEREASRARLLDTWSQLAERYTRRLDEDDIVDIRTGQIVKDNGFLRTTRKFNFGEALASEGAEGDGGNDSQAEEVSEDEEAADELDAFSEGHDFLDILAKGLQPDQRAASNHGSGDTDDLEEFLEAEKRRKEEYGSDVGEEELEPSHTTRGNGSSSPSPSPTTDSEFDNDEEDHNVPYDRPPTSSSLYQSAGEESLSDDELDNWELTEASRVVVTDDARDFPPPDEESESEVEIVESSVPVYEPVQPKKKPASLTQLHTPPNSHSSVDPRKTGRATMPSPRPSPPQRPGRPPPTTQTESVPVSPVKPRAANTKIQTLRRRGHTPEVIDISDDDDENPEFGSSRTPYSPSPSSPSPPPPVRARSSAQTRASHKRKRSSSEYEGYVPFQAPETISKNRTAARTRKTATGRESNTEHHYSSRRSRSKSRYVTPSDDDGHLSSDNGHDQRPCTSRRFASVSAPSNTQPSHTPRTNSTYHPEMYLPFGDPRIQQILAHTMQQIVALQWTPTDPGPTGNKYPYTPSHHRFSSVGPAFMYSTPDHRHPYPFGYDPSLSKATLPPSSPEPPSSPVKPRERRGSLAAGSRSKGRVSFRLDESDDGQSESEVSETSLSEPLETPLETTAERHRQDWGRSRSHQRSKSKGKGKEKAPARHFSLSDSEPDSDHSPKNKRTTTTRGMSMRAQTPGPESRSRGRVSSISIPSSTSSRSSRSLKKGSSKPRTKQAKGLSD